MGKRHAERQIVVAGSPQECFDALADFDSYPLWQSMVRACVVESRDREGRARRVSFNLDPSVRSLAYTLDYSYEAPHLVRWRFVEGDVGNLDGEFVFEDRGDGTTLATCVLLVDPGPSVPSSLVPVLKEHLLRRSVEDLKARVEGGA